MLSPMAKRCAAAGQSIDMAAMQAMIDPADLIIAHNARFDRPCYTGQILVEITLPVKFFMQRA
ncbi:hypothetical protein BJF95_13440 [Rhizobium oryziradicis]|uniref:Exonuclease domain-containing protein n=1 Tax=Rhizobium oryziradicis TaxID=1867956 RepID=A0A1Q8ZKL5_9HYPH|nr:hypothetical protein BJF95_13440 [Rhizobium oryziradicis]